MDTFISHNPAQTEAVGEDWGRAASRGQVFALSGDLGAGKTQLVKGLARGLGITGRIHSPTFSLINVYQGGRLTLFHLDFYRLETRAQIASAGLEEYLRPDGVAAIEWAERWFAEEASAGNPRPPAFAQLTGSALWRVHLETLAGTDRRISYENTGV